MGNSTNKPYLPDSQSREYERFGTVRVSQARKVSPHHTPIIKWLMKFSVSLKSEKQYLQWEQSINRVNDSEAQEIILLPIQKKFKKIGFCGNLGIAELSFDNFPYHLEIEIKNRRRRMAPFTQNQMWYLLYNIIRAANKFEKMNKKIGDVNPKNIVINENGQIKVISLCSLPDEIDNYQKVVEDMSSHVFLAPEQLNEEFIRRGKYPPAVNPCKAEVFSIGLTILSAGILENCFKLYQTPTSLNEIKVNQYLRRLKERYGSFFFEIVCSMLIFPPQSRSKASQIYNKLYKYENQILHLELFQFNESSATNKRPWGQESNSQDNPERRSLKSVKSQPILIRNSVYQRTPSPTISYQFYQ